MARKPMGPEMVERLDGSAEGRKRLRVILETISGQRSVEDAAKELGMSESRFHEMRAQALGAALAGLEPAPAGRPRKEEDPKELALREKEEELIELRLQLRAAELREEIAMVMPHLLKRNQGEEKKRGPLSGGCAQKAREKARRSSGGGVGPEERPRGETPPGPGAGGSGSAQGS